MAARKASTTNNHPATDMNMEEAKKVVRDRALHDIVKKYGEGSIMRLGEAHQMQVEAIPTGSLSLDMALGVPHHGRWSDRSSEDAALRRPE